ncbi:50S ribosomal protein L17 [Candidatus Sumerlaeota bacterium]|nr:50S ribosomal protein L17 [Candidatus Sumerlaeota bacterium]
MRHKKHATRLERMSGHRNALVRNLVEALLTHEKVRTTESRASVVLRRAEKMLTLAREGSQASRRQAFAFLQHKEIVHKLFEELAPRFADRPSGRFRIVKAGPRQGDGAMMAVVEMVDRKIEVITAEEADKKKSRRQRMRDMRRAMARKQ